ncbi:uncharacterized protein M6B38_419485 [Iris pallida]|uniref:Uncharacterized protein n=1 Tax=Iris pallida TaxID=29817 RepID=A0AAX6FIJ0_IRIPA|nr:uncharacterized protein M6B38_419485 [Iris pallida]
MVNAFESSQFQEHRSRGLRTKYSEDKVDGEGYLERASSEERDIMSKSEPPQTIAKSLSSGMLSEHLVPDSHHEAKGTGKAKLSFKKDQKLRDTSSGEDIADKEPTGSKKSAKSLKLTGLVSEDIAVGKSGAMPEPSSQNEEDLEAECKITPTKICPNGDGTDDGNEICSLSEDTHSCSKTTYQHRGSALQTVTGEVECSRSLPSEAAELLTYADIQGYPSGNLGIWGPRHLCITTGSRQLRDLAECCRNSRRPPRMENENLSTRTNHDKQKQHCGASVQENEIERITSCTSGKSEHEKSTSVSKSNSYAGLIEQGVRIAVIIVACVTLLLNTKQRKPGKTIPESKRR